MVCDFSIKETIYLFVCSLCVLGGCSKPDIDYKVEADEQVYKIIDQKWDPNFGSKANYKISDTPPSSNDIQIEKAVPVPGILTLPQAVALATAHNRQYQTEKEALYIKALDLRLTRHEFETQFVGTISGGYSADRNDDAYGFEANLGFSRLLASGTRISTDVAAAWIDVLSGNLRSGLAAILTATVTQPLLRGSDRRVVMENLTQAERDTLYQLRSFNRFRQTFVVSVITQYYEILQLYDEVENTRKYYYKLVEAYKQVEKLASAGRLPKLEMDRIRQERLRAVDIYVQAKKEYKQALDEFKITLGLPTTTEFQLDINELRALRATKMRYPDFSETDAVETALCQRLDLANSADAITDAERKVFVAAVALDADANIVGSASVISERKGNRRTLGFLRGESNVGFELNLPLDRVEEQNIYRKALITLSQRQREYGQAADTVALEVRQAYRDLTEAAERYQVQLTSLAVATKRLENTLLLVQYGRASSRRVLNAQDDLFDAQNDATAALVAHTIATLNFYLHTGVLQVQPDGMWQVTGSAGEKSLPAKLPVAESIYIPKTTHKQPEAKKPVALKTTMTKTEIAHQSEIVQVLRNICTSLNGEQQ